MKTIQAIPINRNGDLLFIDTPKTQNNEDLFV